jgi:hypothetical protein
MVAKKQGRIWRGCIATYLFGEKRQRIIRRFPKVERTNQLSPQGSLGQANHILSFSINLGVENVGFCGF